MAKSIIPDLIAEAPNRRSFVRKLGIASAAVGAAATIGLKESEAATAVNVELEVLNFALNLEYLEAEFYTYAQYGTGIESQGIGTSGVASGANPAGGGTTTGGAKVTFSNNLYFSSPLAAEIGSDERAHVTLLRGALGSSAVAKPNIDLNPLGLNLASQNGFLTLARIFEDIGVTAYAGAAGLLTTPAYITTAARILAAEAEHVASVRVQVAGLRIPSPQLDSVDLVPPPSGPQTQYLSLNTATGLCATRTPGQVLYLAFANMQAATAGGFYPSGLNYLPGTDPAFYTSSAKA
ncbi:MAG: ferritin-like domain-containing protein [Acidobacteriota bacterium]|nr:ferritin-like domain-containing protein [Acidobacteriota bacterium]